MRPRITIPDAAWKRACEYAEATHRNPSQLVVEALEQMQARYPKRPRIDADAEERIVARILEKLAPQVPAGTFGGQES